MRRMLNAWADDARWMMWVGVGFVLMLAMLVVADAAWAQVVFRNGRWVDERSLRGQLDPAVYLALMRFALVAAATGIGFAIGWFLSPQGRDARLAVLLFIGLLGLGLVAFNQGPLGWSVATLLAVIGFAWGLGRWLGHAIGSLLEMPTTFGSAQWAEASHMSEKDLFGEDGIVLGSAFDGQVQSKFAYKGDRHVLTVAPTRSGKGVSHIVPNLLTYQGSVLVIDPKGENAMITAQKRIALGQEVHLVDPWDIAATKSGLTPARFNPLDWIKADDPEATENAMILADALVQSAPKGEAFWIEESKALLQGIIPLVALDETYEGRRDLGTVRDVLLLTGEELTAVFTYMAHSDHSLIRSTGARCLQKEEKLMASVMASAQAETHMLDSHRLRESLSASDFAFEDLKKRNMSVFLILPADRLNAFNRFLRLMVQQAITVTARNIADKPAKPVLFILDEMPALGRLAMVEQAYGLMAGFGMQIWGITQDLCQLRRVYGEDYESFIANSGAVAYFGSPDKRTTEYFSALCGQTTVWNFSTAVATAFSRTFGKSSSSSESNTNTDNRAAAQRKLAYPDELMRMPLDMQLVLIEGTNPIMAHKTRWFEDPDLKAKGVNLRITDVRSQKSED